MQLKSYALHKLQNNFSQIGFNGASENKGLYSIISFSLPKNDKTEMLIYNLDIAGIAVSGGSACNSGSANTSHVLKALNADKDRISIRISFSKNNTIEEIDYFIPILKKLLYS